MSIIDRLDAEWDFDGFLGRLRRGKFSPDEGDGFLEFIESIKIDDNECIPKRLVSLLWYLPSFLNWQRVRVVECGGDIDKFDGFITKTHNALEKILGIP
ncbi:hypothetical protein [Azospirillum sp. B4]|uniref:hypothetical protein n=1 Tax=Azospirillum sp. B4 TaxID=95605 RepID=UPI0011DDAE64|nr:hypothetical protein [Azospirillum sp. B4]